MPHYSSNNCKEFYTKCELSSNDTIDNFNKILFKLESKSQGEESRKLLSEIIQYYDENSSIDFAAKFHFSFIKVDISNESDSSEPLVLLQFPSTFSPEEWSYTFFEGLSRYDYSEFNDKNLVEVGCGNGWITLALARKYNPNFIYGLDINPKAIVASKINLFINSIDENGNLILDKKGKSLLDKVSFHESDLLGYFKGQISVFDSIVGCIPQVLSPSSELVNDILSDNHNDEYLHSLSNYCEKQGYIEDQFGLGLIARSVEESIDLLKTNGKLILNLGGRPGEKVLKRLFERRGMNVEKIWERRVIQAGDTEVTPLVEIENNSPHRFEFFIGMNSNEPISAKTAQTYFQNGGEISHALSVYQFTLNQHKKIANIFNLFKDKDYKSVLSSLDLAYSNKDEAKEKINFLSELSTLLKDTSYFPYAETQGEIVFRTRLAQYFNSYFYTNFNYNQFVIAPSRLSIINNILHIYGPELIIADKYYFDKCNFIGISTSAEIVESPTSSFELCLLIEKVKPQFVISTIDQNQITQVDSFKSILVACEKVSARLIVDISPYLELSSDPNKISILSYVSEFGLPSFCSIICGLTNNKVYKDLQLSMFISQDSVIVDHLSNSAEFTYSRTPILTQLYYSVLIFELLKFQMTKMRTKNVSKALSQFKDSAFIQAKDYALQAFEHPSIKGNTLPIKKETTRLDYGENELSSSKQVKNSILESFVRQHFSAEEKNPSNEIKSFIKNRFGLNCEFDSIHFGNGVAPLFAAVAKSCKMQNGTILFPQGAYGYFYATSKFYDVNLVVVETYFKDSFKVSIEQLSKSIEGIKNPYLFLNFPLVNPTGALYNEAETDELFNLLVSENVNVIIDTVFSGLEFDGVKRISLDKYAEKGLKYTLIGGVSKEFSAGGLRFGFTITTNEESRRAFENYVIDEPHFSIKHTVKRLYHLINEKDKALLDDLKNQQVKLKERYSELNEVLQSLGWKVLPPQGGLFLVAKPEKYIGQKIMFDGKEMLISSSNINEALFYSVGLLINNDVWTGISDYCRFVLSVEDFVFIDAIDKIKAFDRLVKISHKKVNIY
ncbi:MAG: methionine S-methyltransferase [Salibacteraceae bacterium]|jgi:methionine S-methyltransferase